MTAPGERTDVTAEQLRDLRRLAEARARLPEFARRHPDAMLANQFLGVLDRLDALAAALESARAEIAELDAQALDDGELRIWLIERPVALCTNFADHEAHLFDGVNGRTYLCRGVRAALAAAQPTGETP